MVKQRQEKQDFWPTMLLWTAKSSMRLCQEPLPADVREKHAERNFGGYSQERCVDGPRLDIGKYGIEQWTRNQRPSLQRIQRGSAQNLLRALVVLRVLQW